MLAKTLTFLGMLVILSSSLTTVSNTVIEGATTVYRNTVNLYDIGSWSENDLIEVTIIFPKVSATATTPVTFAVSFLTGPTTTLAPASTTTGSFATNLGTPALGTTQSYITNATIG